MTSDPLYDPLGMTPRLPKRARRAGRLWTGTILAVLIGAGFATAKVSQRGHAADRSVVVASIEQAPKLAAPAAAPPPPAQAVPAPPRPAADPDRGNGATVEIQNGVKIIRLGVATSSKSIAIPVPDASLVHLKAAPDPRLVEASRYGDLPRIGPGGLRPAEIYARPVAPAAPDLAGAPRVAILVADMGIDQLATAEAARRLPAAVTFAFPAGSADLAAQVGETRRAGHEVVLQLAPGPDAAPATLPPLTPGATAAESLDRLHGMMGRFAGYAGVALLSGPDVLADAAVARPVLRDIAARGLYFVDDGSLSRNAMQALAPASGLQSAAPNVVIEAARDRAGVAAALDRLADAARSNGTALGIVSQAAASADILAAFAASLRDKGLILVPVSALTGSARQAAQASK